MTPATDPPAAPVEIRLNGEPRSSCRLPVGALGGRSVETLRGRVDDPIGRMVQVTLPRHNDGQCGFLLSGPPSS